MEELGVQDLLMFWMKVYLGTTDRDQLKVAAIDRAYRDYNRTMHGIKSVQNNNPYQVLRSLLLNNYNQIR